MPCYVFVDGQYVREELRQEGHPDEFDPRKPASFVQNIDVAGAKLVASRIFYYDAVDEGASAEQVERQRSYLARVQQLQDTHVVEGQVRQGKRKPEQKGVDVQLAVDALQAANRGVVGAIALVSGDADFVPLARAIRDVGPHVIVIAFRESLSKELRAAADRTVILDERPSAWELSSGD